MAAFDGALSSNKLEVANELVMTIFETYLSKAAQTPLNIPDAMRQRIISGFQQESLCDLPSLSHKSTLLNEARHEVLALMEKDNYSRFKVSQSCTGPTRVSEIEIALKWCFLVFTLTAYQSL